MSDEKLLTRVRQLIALASSPNENEARSAAFQACALIREHKLVIGLIDEDGCLRTTRADESERRPRSAGVESVAGFVQLCRGCGTRLARAGAVAGFCERCATTREAVGQWIVICSSCSAHLRARSRRDLIAAAAADGWHAIDGRARCGSCA